MSQKRDAYVESMKKKQDKWSAEIEKMETWAREAEEEVKSSVQQRVGRLRAGGTAGKELQTGAETSWKILRKAVRTAMANFKGEDSPPAEKAKT